MDKEQENQPCFDYPTLVNPARENIGLKGVGRRDVVSMDNS